MCVYVYVCVCASGCVCVCVCAYVCVFSYSPARVVVSSNEMGLEITYVSLDFYNFIKA